VNSSHERKKPDSAKPTDKDVLGLSVKKSEDFSEWYTQVVLKAELTDYASGKGFTVLRPYGFEIWDQIRTFFDSKIKKTGHKNAYFPTLIPESLLRKEAEHFEGFTPEVFWVTRSGTQELSEKYAVRPTSETIIHDSMSKWIRSWRDLPMLLNVWNSVLRAEIKSTKPFIRSAEFLWQEGHTAHATEKEAEKEVMDILLTYRQVVEELLSIPVLIGKKTDKEKFVGAVYTTTLESMMPDGKAVQMGTSHHLGQNFSKQFEIRFLGEDSQLHFVWQTSWGISWRLIGALVMEHGDDKGLLLPPRVAPIQIAIVPIVFSSSKAGDVLAKCNEVTDQLTAKSLRVFLDARENYTPGWKFNEWELKGVPLRIEIGPRDIANNTCIFVRRGSGSKESVSLSKVAELASQKLDEIQSSMFAKARDRLKAQTFAAKSYAELKRIVDSSGGFVRAGWCGSQDCEIKVKEESGSDIRLIPFDEKIDVGSKCVVCGKNATQIAYFAKAY
jgi:prolyl-tRNA synthetase